VRVRTEHGEITEVVDIRRRIGIEMEFEVLRSGHVLAPYMSLHNEKSECVFTTTDLDPEWRRRPRPAGRYVSTAWIPGNLLPEGTFCVGANLATHDPYSKQFAERDAVAFNVVDSMDGDSARGDWASHWAGVVRPVLQWTTRFIPPGDK
jgi:lipopolysaccharide transport system ATP-binding protein